MASRTERVSTIVVLTALIVGGIAIPAQAELAPGAKITAIPDGGSRPATTATALLPTGDLALPKGPTVDPLAALQTQVRAAEVESGLLAERVNELEEDLDRAKLSQAWAEFSWQQADEKLKAAKEAAAAAATSAYLSKDKLPVPMQDKGLVSDLLQLRPGATPPGQGAAFDLEKAAAEEQTTRMALEKANTEEKALAVEVASATETFVQRDNARLLLDQRRIQLESSEALRREREISQLAVNYDAGQSNEGLMANPDARKIVLYALQQLGKPYMFAEEGPDYFDCSGLTQTSYRQAGILLPRVANDQFYAFRSKQVRLSALLPGDLLFYARDPGDWRTIHHVMIYLGKENGVPKIVHAPRTGDVVKISNINLGSGTQVDFAVRVLDAVPVPVTPAPTPTPPPTVTPTTPTGNPGA
jgi:cell wall-associated NlpC family hydrolase